MLPSTCSKVSLRQRPIKNDRLSLYLDYYPAIRKGHKGQTKKYVRRKVNPDIRKIKGANDKTLSQDE